VTGTNNNLWLDPGTKDVSAVSELLKPYDARAMRSYAFPERCYPSMAPHD
jgi:hypothetical protein